MRRTLEENKTKKTVFSSSSTVLSMKQIVSRRFIIISLSLSLSLFSLLSWNIQLMFSTRKLPCWFTRKARFNITFWLNWSLISVTWVTSEDRCRCSLTTGSFTFVIKKMMKLRRSDWLKFPWTVSALSIQEHTRSVQKPTCAGWPCFGSGNLDEKSDRCLEKLSAADPITVYAGRRSINHNLGRSRLPPPPTPPSRLLRGETPAWV